MKHTPLIRRTPLACGTSQLARTGKPRPMSQKKAPAPTPLRNSARGETCTLRLDGCDGGTETTVLAHLRHFGWAGTGHKPPDYLAVFACHRCHDAIDGRSNHAEHGYDDLLRALGETLNRQVAKGKIIIGEAT